MANDTPAKNIQKNINSLLQHYILLISFAIGIGQGCYRNPDNPDNKNHKILQTRMPARRAKKALCNHIQTMWRMRFCAFIKLYKEIK